MLDDYRRAAENAKRAGFDGVELHGANGYLLAQFMSASTNTRTDAYGGSTQNRVRLTLEAIDALLQVWDGGQVGIRVSPVSPANDMQDSDPAATFGYLADELSRRGVGFMHVVEGATAGPRDNQPFDYLALRKAFRGAYIANNGYDRELAIEAVRENRADLIAFGRPFISNPDLVDRLRTGAPLNEPDQATFYGGDAHGYTDYPALAAAK